jgi:2-(1,2-epoxy-1,2-dihydrophenyl)acetyl-CoA isomerase
VAEAIFTSKQAGVVTVTISNPTRKNAATRQMFVDLARAFEEAQSARLLVVKGDGQNFCTGADLSDVEGMGGQSPIEFMRTVSETALRLHELTIPKLAVVDGLAVGAGLSLAAGCDLILATTRSSYSAIFAKRGLSLDLGASWFLPRRIGVAKAKELTLLANLFGADEALAMGLINWVVEPEDLAAREAELTNELSNAATMALRRSNALLDASAHSSLAEALEAESQSQVESFSSEDTKEAAIAFFQKRTAKFIGQ